MAALNMTIEHGQSWESARASFEKGIVAAEARYGRHITRVAWSDDRTSALLSGTGFEVTLTVDPRAVYARGRVPFFFRMLEGPIRKFVQDALGPT